jgi:hypothetical protein
MVGELMNVISRLMFILLASGFPKSDHMHDILIGLFINREEFGIGI